LHFASTCSFLIVAFLGKRINNIAFLCLYCFSNLIQEKMNLLEKMNGLVASVSEEAMCKRKSQQLKRSKKLVEYPDRQMETCCSTQKLRVKK
jgi:hypothetical protein